MTLQPQHIDEFMQHFKIPSEDRDIFLDDLNTNPNEYSELIDTFYESTYQLI